MELHPKIKQELRQLRQHMQDEGDLSSVSQLEGFYAAFRERFGPDVLANLDGQELLSTMHEHGREDSLVYWLEFKNDEEFRTIQLGSIAGGSALKFGIYRRKETGAWMTGSPQKQREISQSEAVDIARQHRDQLLVGCRVLEDNADIDPIDSEYRKLERVIYEAAPDVADKAWGHKYFSLLYPQLLDDYHVEKYQTYNLIRLLQIPPEDAGKYAPAGRFVALSRQMNMHLNHLTATLNRRHGTPRTYWRIGTTPGGGKKDRWNLMRDQNCVAIGWDKLGDLSDVDYTQSSKDRVKELMGEHYPGDPRTVGRDGSQVFYFVARIAEDDIVVAMKGQTVRGIGRVTGDYVYEDGGDVPHRRPVEWLALDQWKFPQQEGLRSTVRKLDKHPENLVATERHILQKEPAPHGRANVKELPSLPHLIERIDSLLERKRQLILYGPPGTGKTYWALRAAEELASRDRFGKTAAYLTDDQRTGLQKRSPDDSGLIRMCCFHPAYGYEDFIEGYRPSGGEDRMNFELRDGLFKRLCRDAESDPDHQHYLIIDEINRGDIPRIFGELLTVLDKDKRGRTIMLPVSGERLRVPDNVCIIATMNTADRSIALLDVALRRRFGFHELMPDYSLLQGSIVQDIALGPWLEAVNARIRRHVGRDARNLQIGHAYLMDGTHPVKSFRAFKRAVRDEIVPLLQEYCYEDYQALQRILGETLVDVEKQRIRMTLFEDGNEERLRQALSEIYQEVATSAEAVAAEENAPVEDTDLDE